jgi:3-oxoacyl-[acyl-carrier protein] reductase
MRLKDKVALITGGARGIGKRIATKIGSEGARIIIWDIDEDTGRKTEKEILESTFMKVNICNFREVHEGVQKCLNNLGKIDILVNNAGITRDALLLRMKESDFDQVLSVNLKGTFNCTKAVIPSMLKKRWGRIISISSVIGIIGNKGQANYAASKAGIIAFTKSVAKEVATRGITCNCIAPGYIETEMTRGLSEEVKNAYRKLIPIPRLGAPEDVANLVLFLASDDSSYITGQVIHVDGGMVM